MLFGGSLYRGTLFVGDLFNPETVLIPQPKKPDGRAGGGSGHATRRRTDAWDYLTAIIKRKRREEKELVILWPYFVEMFESWDR